MPDRTTETTVPFRRPFTLPELERPQPAGAYRLATDEEEISGRSFLALRRIAKLLRPSVAAFGGSERMNSIDVDDLADVLKADGENR